MQFGQVLLDKLEGIRAATKPGSLGGQEIRLHNEQQAHQLKRQGLVSLNLTEADLVELAKGSIEKRVLAWFIKHQTTVSNAWISEQLHCGHPANVPAYVKSIRDSKNRKIRRLCKSLLKTQLNT